MTAIERTAYPRFKSQLTQDELQQLFMPDPAELLFVRDNAKGNRPRFTLLVLLKCFQPLGYFPLTKDIPLYILHFLRSSQSYPSATMLTDNPATLSRYRFLIRDYLSVQPYREGGEQIVQSAVQEAARNMNNPADLINVAIEELVHHRFELPAYRVLNRMVAHIRQQTNDAYYDRILAQLEAQDLQELDRLLQRPIGQFYTTYHLMKQAPGRAIFSQIRAHTTRLQSLQKYLNTAPILQDIPPKRIQQFADEARSIDAGDLKRYNPPHRYTLLVCLLHHTRIKIRDELVHMFIKRMRSIHKSAARKLSQLREQQQGTVEHLVDVLQRLLKLCQQSFGQAADFQQSVLSTLKEEGGIDALLEACGQVNTYRGNNALPLMQAFFKRYRGTLFDLLDLIDIRAPVADHPVLHAMHFIRDHRQQRATYLAPDVPIAFASQQWQRLILHRQHGEIFYERRQLELCVFSYLSVHLLAGDLYVQDSYEYANPFAQLLSLEECAKRLPEYAQRTGFPDTAKAFTQFLLDWLDSMAQQVSENFPDEGQIYFKDGEPILRQLPRQTSPEGAKQLRAALAERMPAINLLDILAYTERLVNFTRHFGPLSGSDPGLANPLLTYIMTTFAYGSNMGPNQTARHSRGQISASDISRANIRHSTVDKIDAGQRDIVNFYIRFDLVRYWGSGKASASDGTLINLYQNNLLSAYHLRYGEYGGVAYHHVSDTYIALFTHFISVGVWEAVYIIDGLLQNTSEIQPEMLHADTQGQSLPVFAFAHLLGIQLLPRIRNWKDLTLFRPRKASQYEHIDDLFTDVIDAALIESHWQLMMQVILSIEAGVILPSTLLRRLGNYSRQNSLYRAFREVGRLVRTVFLLRLISDEAMRLQIRSVTNISESYHEFASWVSFGGQVLPTNDPVEQEKRSKYNQLLASCIILKNVIDMSAILPELAKMGYVVTPETIRTLSPYMTEHIRRFGDYVIDFDHLPDEPVSFNLHFDPPQYGDDSDT